MDRHLKSTLPVLTALFGWAVFFIYILYDYDEYKGNVLNHFFHNKDIIENIFHFLILTAPLGSTITAYLINERNKLFTMTKISEEKLKNAANDWIETFDAMPYGIILTDKHCKIIRANQYFADLIGVSAEELVHMKCGKSIDKEGEPHYGCPLKEAVESKSVKTVKYYSKTLDRYFEEIVKPIYEKEGDPVIFIHLIQDITDSKHHENKVVNSRDAFFNMLKDIDVAHKDLKGLYNNLIIAFANVIDTKSEWTRGHSTGVTNYALTIAREMRLEDQDIEILSTAALLHDIGKIGTYDEILDKPSRLTSDEFAIVKMHPAKGEKILKPIKGFESMLVVIRAHHERIDGTGYPDGLKGDDIPLLARILCVADAYDSMVSNRPYRPSLGKEYAISELRRCSGAQFDPDVVEVFIKLMQRKDS